MSKTLASLSLDLDNEWAYLKTRGDPAWKNYPSYLDVFVPTLLETLRRHALTITVFVVGKDAGLEKNVSALRAISGAGHEIANHSFHHEPWIDLYSRRQVAHEIAEAEDRIEKATGQRPRGFRGPGFSLSRNVLETLIERGYLYDATTLPTFIGPLARAFYFAGNSLSAQQRELRKGLFGNLSDCLLPMRAYERRLNGGAIVEIPVTTMPFFKTPIHVSYLQYIAQFSERMALAYFDLALRLCRLRGIAPSLLLHPLDFLSSEESPRLAFFPAMRRSRVSKLKLVDRILEEYRRHFDVVTMSRHARAILN